MLSRHSHLSEDFRDCPQHEIGLTKAQMCPRLEEGSAMSMLIAGRVDVMTFKVPLNPKHSMSVCVTEAWRQRNN